jgi:hypothetical protein
MLARPDVLLGDADDLVIAMDRIPLAIARVAILCPAGSDRTTTFSPRRVPDTSW